MINNWTTPESHNSFYEFMLKEHSGKLAWDVGANDGGSIYLKDLSRYFEKVYAFEPVPWVFEKLQSSKPDNVFPHQIALGEAKGKLDQRRLVNEWSIVGPAPIPDGLPKDQVDDRTFDIDIESADNLSMVYGAPEFIKLDVDGWEMKFFRGGKDFFLRQAKPPILYESSFLSKLLGDDPSDVVNLIYDYGYKVVSWDGCMFYPTAKDVMAVYPWHSSEDVWLISSYKVKRLLERYHGL